MTESHPRGVQRRAGQHEVFSQFVGESVSDEFKKEVRIATVEFVADDGKTRRFQVRTNLMVTSRFRETGYKRINSVR